MKLSLGLTPRDYSVAGGAVSYDADAQAYFTANTAITSTADKNAINDFYLGLKSDGIYTLIDAMYLPIWGTSASSKWNLINNRSFDLTFATGWTFSSSGMTPNGATYSDTGLNPSALPIPVNDIHISFYSRTNITPAASTDIGCWTNPSANYTLLALGTTLGSYAGLQQTSFADYPVFADSDSRGFYIGTRTASNLSSIYKNGTLKDTSAQASTGNGNNTFFIGSGNGNSPNYSTKQCCFSSIGRKLTNTQASNLSSRVNTLMAYFGINTYPVVSDSDAQAYINANDAITSQSDANAINTFFTGLKADGVYTKIKAMYLPIWGSAASCKWNLVNPLDTDAAFRLTFSTGWTFSSGGMTPNGTSAYADSFLVPSTNLILQNNHFSYYSRTSGNPSASQIFIGVDGLSGLYNNKAVITLGYTNSGLAYSTQHSEAVITDQAVSPTQSTRLGFWMNSRTSSTATTLKIFKNGNSLANATTSTAGQQLNTGNIFIAARNNTTLPGAANFTNCQCSFASIGDGLTDTDATNFYNRVNTLMTYFGINV